MYLLKNVCVTHNKFITFIYESITDYNSEHMCWVLLVYLYSGYSYHRDKKKQHRCSIVELVANSKLITFL